MKEHTTAIGSKHTEYSDKGSAVGDRIVLAIKQSYKVSEALLSLIHSMKSSSYTELLKICICNSNIILSSNFIPFLLFMLSLSLFAASNNKHYLCEP